jgi:hypothetical protein
MMSSAEFEVKFRAIERAHGTVNLHEYFQELIAEMLECTADSLNVPRAFMISGVIMLAASFSPDVYVSGPGSMNESLIFMFLELAPPGSNKSGMCKLFQRVLVLTAITVAMFCLLADSSRNGARAVLCWDRLLANTNPN